MIEKARTESAEVLNGLGDDLAVEAQDDAAKGCLAAREVQEDALSKLGLGRRHEQRVHGLRGTVKQEEILLGVIIYPTLIVQKELKNFISER